MFASWYRDMELKEIRKRFTWSSLHNPSNFAQLDRFFKSLDLTVSSINTKCSTLQTELSDHVLPRPPAKASIFHFENKWLAWEGFQDLAQNC